MVGRRSNDKQTTSSVSSVSQRYECNVCTKAYKYPSQLGQHLRCHKSLTRFRCNQCGKSFRWHSQLRKHELMHDDASVQPETETVFVGKMLQRIASDVWPKVVLSRLPDGLADSGTGSSGQRRQCRLRSKPKCRYCCTASGNARGGAHGNSKPSKAKAMAIMAASSWPKVMLSTSLNDAILHVSRMAANCQSP